MMQGALDALGARMVRGLVIAPHDGLAQGLLVFPHITCLAGDHPVPGERSLAAGSAALAFADATPAGSRVLLLISGGASANQGEIGVFPGGYCDSIGFHATSTRSVNRSPISKSVIVPRRSG